MRRMATSVSCEPRCGRQSGVMSAGAMRFSLMILAGQCRRGCLRRGLAVARRPGSDPWNCTTDRPCRCRELVGASGRTICEGGPDTAARSRGGGLVRQPRSRGRLAALPRQPTALAPAPPRPALRASAAARRNVLEIPGREQHPGPAVEVRRGEERQVAVGQPFVLGEQVGRAKHEHVVQRLRPRRARPCGGHATTGRPWSPRGTRAGRPSKSAPRPRAWSARWRRDPRT